MRNKDLIEKLKIQRGLAEDEWVQIIDTFDEEDLRFAMDTARGITIERFGKKIYFRGIVEFTNVCRNDCYYCGIRCSNSSVQRYRLDEEEYDRIVNELASKKTE